MSGNEKPVLHRIPVFPFLLALSPVLVLYTVNNWGSYPVEYIRPALAHLLFVFLVYIICLKILGSSRKAAVLSFVPIFSVITFGHASNLIYSISGSNIPDLYFFAVWVLITLGISYLLARVLRKSRNQLFELTAILNTFGVVLYICRVCTWLYRGFHTTLKLTITVPKLLRKNPLSTSGFHQRFR